MKNKKEDKMKRAQEAIRGVAYQKGVSESAARREMEQAIRQAITRSRMRGDKAALEKWASIPCQGEIPTPEELIIWIAEHSDSHSNPTFQ